MTLTGILLVSDWRCDEWPADVPKDKWACPEGSSQWGLITATKQYLVRGITSELKKYERRRVAVTGTVTAITGDVPIDKLEVQSIASTAIAENQLRALIEQLRSDRWTDPENLGNPTMWAFHFTPPMIQILQAGSTAQDVLLQYLDDSQIKDHIIVLLGGIGDEKAVVPIINAMASPTEARESAYGRKVNLMANLALTNITVGEIIWHHGGGITIDRCPDDPKSCWSAWWLKNRETFDVSHTVNRNYSNYPGYGIYQSPGTFRSEYFHPEH
jgi:hypothetical protein